MRQVGGLALIALLGLSACGKSDEQAIADATQAFFATYDDRQYQKACNQLTDQFQRFVVGYVGAAAARRGVPRPSTCGDALRINELVGSPFQVAGMKFSDVSRIQIGDRTAHAIVGPNRSLGLKIAVALKRRPSGWRIYGLRAAL